VIGDYSETAGARGSGRMIRIMRSWESREGRGSDCHGSNQSRTAGEIATGRMPVAGGGEAGNVAMEMKRWRSLAESTDYQKKSESPAA